MPPVPGEMDVASILGLADLEKLFDCGGNGD